MHTMDHEVSINDWLKTNSGINTPLLAALDINGVMNGKSVPLADVLKVANAEVRMALSTATVNIWGNEINGTSQVFETGDCGISAQPTDPHTLPKYSGR